MVMRSFDMVGTLPRPGPVDLRNTGSIRGQTTHPQKEHPMTGQIVHFEIPADDTGAGQAFWGSLFGWEFQAFPGPFEYHMTRIGEQTGAAITNMEPGKRGTRAYFSVEEINAGAARVRELGGQAGDPMPVPGMGCSPPAPTRRATSSDSGRTTKPLPPRTCSRGHLPRGDPPVGARLRPV